MKKIMIILIATNFLTGCKTLNPAGFAALNTYIQQDLQQRDQRRQFNAVNTRLQPINRPQVIIQQPEPVNPYSDMNKWGK